MEIVETIYSILKKLNNVSILFTCVFFVSIKAYSIYNRRVSLCRLKVSFCENISNLINNGDEFIKEISKINSSNISKLPVVLSVKGVGLIDDECYDNNYDRYFSLIEDFNLDPDILFHINNFNYAKSKIVDIINDSGIRQVYSNTFYPNKIMCILNRYIGVCQVNVDSLKDKFKNEHASNFDNSFSNMLNACIKHERIYTK